MKEWMTLNHYSSYKLGCPT